MPPVWGDEDRLQQILYNLIGNAIKFTDQGEIRVSAVQKTDLVEVSITDTGTGIPEDKQDGIFQPFVQADSSDNRAYSGAGLGLSITRQLVELHGGRIYVKSAPGAGSDFTFTIPIARYELPVTSVSAAPEAETITPKPVPLAAAHEPADDLPGFDKGIVILAVDDDPVNLQVVANHLAFRNVVVITASSGMQAVKEIEEGLMPDLVLLDIMMPRMTGYEVVKWLRQRYTKSELPVIMLTAKDRTGDLVEGFSRGANDYIVKPFSRDELLARVVSQLMLKDSYLTLRENMALRKELSERRQVERELRCVQQTLSRMLDTVEDALLAVNDNEEITFCNRRCEGLLGLGMQEILGMPFNRILHHSGGDSLPDDRMDAVRRCINAGGNTDMGIVALRRAGGDACRVRALLSHLDMEDESVCVMILKETVENGHDGKTARLIEQSFGIIEAINRNRSRLSNIKTSLNGLLPVIDEKHPEFLRELKAIDDALDHAGKAFLAEEDYENRRRLALEVMTCAVGHWTEATGLTKAELAHQSGL